MKKVLWMFVGIFGLVMQTSLITYGAEKDCQKPQPIYGKIIAICGDQMITYVGDEKINILGINSTISHFELAYCSNGGGRKDLHLETNSEGFRFRHQSQITRKHYREHYEISNMWGDFQIYGIGYYGEKVEASCSFYDDKRVGVRYLFQ